MLTPSDSRTATQDNYTYWNGRRLYPNQAGYVYEDKLAFALRVYEDYDWKLPPPKLVNVYEDHHMRGNHIGHPGFGWVWTGEGWLRFPHIGGVVFGEGVDLGCNVTIDRGALGDTIIGTGVKIDNGVHVGHNVTIGAHSLLTAHSVIGGSAIIGNRTWIGLGAQIKNQIVIGNDVTVGMGAIVVKDVPSGMTVKGNPAK